MSSKHTLNPFERSLLTALTAGDHATLRALRTQSDAATVRQRRHSSFGLETLVEVPNEIPAVQPSDFSLSDVGFELFEEPGAASLRVSGGFLAELKAHLIFEMWPEDAEAGSAPWYQAQSPFSLGPFYTGPGPNWRLPQRDIARIRETLAT